MANGTISGDALVAFKGSLFIPAVDTTLANGQQNVKLLASTFPNQSSLQLSFLLPSLQSAGGVCNLVIAVPMTVAAGFVGTETYCGTPATNNAVFTVNQISLSTGITTLVGTVTLTPVSHTSAVLTATGAITLAAGDVFQLVLPTPADPTLADIGITFLAYRI